MHPGYTITVDKDGSYWFTDTSDGYFAFGYITTDHFINTRFSPFTITTTAGAVGSISPNGNVNVNIGNDQVFNITPDAGYRIVDGVSQGAISTYTFNNVQDNHQISAKFVKTYTITVNVNDPSPGSITPNGTFIVDTGSNVRFNVYPNPNVGGEIILNDDPGIDLMYPGIPIYFVLGPFYQDCVLDVVFIQK